ncbi:DoxX family protein [Chitinophaga ginsengisegetis]|uniref:DoxX family protein n=1 Tax=Chitinophaga ginsengisegetis TaxID=393003 RepID=UPI00342161DF
MSNVITAETPAWKDYEKIGFRVIFIYFLLQALPFDWKFYSYLFSTPIFNLHYEDIFNLANFTTRFGAGPATYADWGILLIIAVAGAIVWTYTDRQRTRTYDEAFYWLRVILRYRLALALLAYGFLKLYALQAPYPSLSSLNTPYGDFNRWKLFSLSLGIVPSYELFLGGVEIGLALLLLFRKTASIGAFMFLIFCGNIFMSNLAYEGGDQVYSLLLITYAFVILSFDLQRIIRLLILQQPTAAATFKPVFEGIRKNGRWILKTAFLLFFVVIYGVKTGVGAKHDPYQYPATKGLPAISGLYNVATFIVNGDTLAYSLTDSLRWRNVVFEEWNTISIRTNKPALVDSNNLHLVKRDNAERLYEIEGTSGRHYYSYAADTTQHLLTLQNRHPALSAETLSLHYSRPDTNRVILTGTTYSRDSIYVVLEKVNKKYLLEEVANGGGRNRKLKL